MKSKPVVSVEPPVAGEALPAGLALPVWAQALPAWEQERLAWAGQVWELRVGVEAPPVWAARVGERRVWRVAVLASWAGRRACL